jgi:hypothetical protein
VTSSDRHEGDNEQASVEHARSRATPRLDYSAAPRPRLRTLFMPARRARQAERARHEHRVSAWRASQLQALRVADDEAADDLDPRQEAIFLRLREVAGVDSCGFSAATDGGMIVRVVLAPYTEDGATQVRAACAPYAVEFEPERPLWVTDAMKFGPPDPKLTAAMRRLDHVTNGLEVQSQGWSATEPPVIRVVLFRYKQRYAKRIRKACLPFEARVERAQPEQR